MNAGLAQGGGMHTLTVRTKFTFGDRVRFDSKVQGCSGSGTICGITMYDDGEIDYMIRYITRQGEPETLQPGIVQDEITLLADTE
jgi:hypothetical protein